MSTEITIAERARQESLDCLQPSEILEYEKQCRSGKPDLSPEANKRLYELFVNGLSIQNMADMNPGFSLGMILKARVDGRWDNKRSEYLGELLGDVPSRMKQLAAEALGFMSLQLAVAHKEHGAAMRKYLQTGDPKDLGGFRIQGFKEYRSVIESISKLLEAGKGKGDGAAPLVNVNVASGSSVTLSADDEGGLKFTPEEADAIRAHLEGKK